MENTSVELAIQRGVASVAPGRAGVLEHAALVLGDRAGPVLGVDEEGPRRADDDVVEVGL
jgi:hypothetical protein